MIREGLSERRILEQRPEQNEESEPSNNWGKSFPDGIANVKTSRWKVSVF